VNYRSNLLAGLGLIVSLVIGSYSDSAQALTPPPVPPSSRAALLFNRGVDKFLAGNYAGAIADYNLALRAQPKWVEVYIARGEARRRLGDFQGAIADSTRALQLDANSVDALTNRCAARYAKGDYQGAIVDCSQSLTLDPTDADALYNRALAYRQQGAIQEAANDFQQAAEFYQQQLDVQSQAPLPPVDVDRRALPSGASPVMGVPTDSGGEGAPPAIQPELLRSAPIMRGGFAQPRGRGIPGRREAAGSR
jgi:tetratricopeptide (TPR) repeat protein